MLDVIATRLAIFGRRAPRLVSGKSLRSEGRRLHGKRLGWRSDFARDVALRNSALFDGEDGLASVAVQNVEQPGLVALNDDGDVLPIEMQGRQQGRRGAVEIPEVMMNELEAPGELAGFAAQGDDRIGPPVVARAKSAIVIGAGASCGDEK